MNRHERRASKAKAKTDAGKPQALAVLHAAILKETLAGRYLEALSRCREALALEAIMPTRSIWWAPCIWRRSRASLRWSGFRAR